MAGKLLSTQLLVLRSSRRCFSSKSDKNVAFLGLGNMGQHMAANLVKKGFTVRGYDASGACVERAAAAGVTPARTVTECVRGAGVVVTALPNNDVVRDVYLGDAGVVASVDSGALLIDSSTVEPCVAQEVARAAEGKGHAFIDAPMSGGVMGAKNATLAFMVGGEAAAAARAEPVLSALGARRVHCGGAGAGQVAKLVNNLLMAINMAGTAECMNLGIRMGLEPAALLEVINNSSGRSWCSEVYCPVPGLLPNAPSTAGYAGGFKVDLLVKDVGLASSMINTSRTTTPLGSLATQLYRLLQSKGHGEKDFSYIYQFLKQNE